MKPSYTSTNFTFRQLIYMTIPGTVHDPYPVLDILDKKHGDDDSREGYRKVIAALIALPTTAPKYPILVQFVPVSPHNEEEYIDVSFWNPNYVKPPVHLKPTYGLCGKLAPEGCYDAEADIHQSHFGVGLTSWNELIDAEVYLDSFSFANVPTPTLAQIAAEILWEITFYGFTQEKIEKVKNDLMDDVNEYKKGKKQ